MVGSKLWGSFLDPVGTHGSGGIIGFDERLQMGLFVGFGKGVELDSNLPDDLDIISHFHHFSSFEGFDALGGLWKPFWPYLAHFRVCEGPL